MRMTSQGMAALVVAGLCASQAAAFGKRHAHGCDGGAAQTVIAGTHQVSAVTMPALVATHSVVTATPVRPAVVRGATFRSAVVPSALGLTDLAPSHLFMAAPLPVTQTHLMAAPLPVMQTHLMAAPLPVTQTHLAFGLVGLGAAGGGTGNGAGTTVAPTTLAAAANAAPACDRELAQAIRELNATLSETNRHLDAISRRAAGPAAVTGGTTIPFSEAARGSEGLESLPPLRNTPSRVDRLSQFGSEGSDRIPLPPVRTPEATR